MKITKTLALLAISSSLSFGAIAHEHGAQKKGHGKQYDCEAVNKMDQSQMDMNDPKMQAMMKACGGGHGHNNGHNSKSNHGKNQHNDGHGGHGKSGHRD